MNPGDPNFAAWSELLGKLTFQAFLVACVIRLYLDSRQEARASRENTRAALQEFAEAIKALAAALEKQADAVMKVYGRRSDSETVGYDTQSRRAAIVVSRGEQNEIEPH